MAPSAWMLCSVATLLFLSGTILGAVEEIQDFDFDIDSETKVLVKQEEERPIVLAKRKVPDDEDMLADEAGSGPDDGSGEPPPPDPALRASRVYRVSITSPTLTYTTAFQSRSSREFTTTAGYLRQGFQQMFQGMFVGDFLPNVFALERASSGRGTTISLDMTVSGDMQQNSAASVRSGWETLTSGQASFQGYQFNNEGFSFRALEGRPRCTEFVGREPTGLPRAGDNWAKLLINNAFPCDGEVTGWEYYRLKSEGSAYVGVWRLTENTEFVLMGKTELPPAPVGVQTVDLAVPIQVSAGDFIGIFYARDTPNNLIAQATIQDDAVPAEQLYQNYRIQVYNEDIYESIPLDINFFPVEIANATFALRAAVRTGDDVTETGGTGAVNVCGTNEFDCGDDYCIALNYQCDGQTDCNNGADEIGCTFCQNDMFLCKDGTCITENFVCDNRQDCADGSDEADCDKLEPCLEGRFRCDDGTCIPRSYRCDGTQQCPDGSDEKVNLCFPRECQANEFQCASSTECIPIESRCDRLVDCEDSSDEENCPPEECGEGFFQCYDGTCIDEALQCDSKGDCSSGEDEFKCASRACKSYEFRCENSKCIPLYQRCDSVSNCRDGSDELDCPARACDPATEFECVPSGQCIAIDLKCNGVPDCMQDLSDEDIELCSSDVATGPPPCTAGSFRCPSGVCIDESSVCDRKNDCLDGSDEQNCEDRACREDQFRCGDGQCIDGSLQCDGLADCNDYSDEISCQLIINGPIGEVDLGRRHLITCNATGGMGIPENIFWYLEPESGAPTVNITARFLAEVDPRQGEYYIRELRRDGYFFSELYVMSARPEDAGMYTCRVSENLSSSYKLMVASEACGPGEYQCADLQCIDNRRRCDRRRDCRDGSDERGCTSCSEDSFRCRGGECIDGRSRCDGQADCRDMSDEEDCPANGCRDDEFTCGNGRCFPQSVRCNGIDDCGDNSDERGCPRCRATEFECDNGECVDARSRCNRNRECSDYSDEFNCNCTSREFTCRSNRECFPQSAVCDNVRDCVDGSDEENCEPDCRSYEFVCDNRCMDNQRKCDGNRDCRDGVDEAGCPPVSKCPDNEFQCGSGNCVAMDARCDGNTDCPDATDEVGCPARCREGEFTCVSDGRCLPPGYRCSGSPECEDGSDEEGCPARCADNEFTCANRECVPDYQRCDGQVQCGDGSDERGCRDRQSISGIEISPREMRKRVGTSASFICIVDGLRNPDIRWERRTGGAMPPQAETSGNRLTIVNLRPEDSGDYKCVVETARGPVEAHARLSVEYVGPSIVEPGPDGPCGRDQSTCTNGQCIPRDYVCDGEADCTDGSDEDSCSVSLPCEPNEFRCDNGRCAVKIWRCDGDDDCLDNSDEKDCPAREPGAPCRPDEFTCSTGSQCVPASYQCDGENDCFDLSDERACIQPSIVRPPEKETIVEIGGNFTIRCDAIGVPTPLIVWRLNWGNIPQGPRVMVSSVGGRGVLTVTRAAIEDAGAYTCEALNNRGSIFAVPDAIIIVRRTPGICKTPFFNANALSTDDCIRCFCFGQTQTCLSSKLQYSQITLGNQVAIVRRDTLEPADSNFVQYIPVSREFQVTDFNTILRTGSYYWSLPYQFLSKRINSYGGELSYQVYYEVDQFDIATDDPDVIITGNGITLYHKSGINFDPNRPQNVRVKLVESEWNRSPDTRLAGPISNYATREDIMLALENVTSILIRATYDNRQSLIRLGNVLLATGVPQDTGLGRAFAIEECTCPPGYTGNSCEECAPGFYRISGDGPFNRRCVACNCNGHSTECDQYTGVCKNCRDNTVGDYCQDCARGYVMDPRTRRCTPCPCPLSNPENQFSPTCFLDSDSQVTCDACPRGYTGRQCERCDDGFEGNPTELYGSCRPLNLQDICDERGSLSQRADPLTGQCKCKANTEGRRCDSCKRGTFYMSNDFPDGCISCFCMSVTEQCQSTTFNRAQVRLTFGSLQPEGIKLTDKNREQMVDTGFFVDRGQTVNEVVYRDFNKVDPSITYWSLPSEFLGNKVTAYGGSLRYTIRYTPGVDNSPLPRYNALVEIMGNGVEMLYLPRTDVPANTPMAMNIPMIENEWRRNDGSQVSRPDMIMALSDVDYINIRAVFTRDTSEAGISAISMDIAEDRNTGQERAYAVEECVCPRGYMGLSCQDCAPGYTRNGGGLYLGLCMPCRCNGHSNECDPETGVCRNCRDNTVGEFCDQCARGFYGDATRGTSQDCQRCPCPLTESPNQFSPDCILDTDNQVTCTACPPGHTGRQCERCEAGYMGNPRRPGDSCKQMNVTCDCDARGTLPNTFCDPNTQQCQCKNNVVGLRCSSCRDGYFNLAQDNEAGCMRCFCMDITDQCTSSRYYKAQVVPMFNSDGTHNFQLIDRREIRSISDGFTMNAERNEITFNAFSGIQRERESLFFSLPPKFRGDKVSSYGGYLRFGLSFSRDLSSSQSDYNDVDVEILSGGNGRGRKRFIHILRPSPQADRQSDHQVLLTEDSFRDQGARGGSITRENFMVALANIDAILIRATFHPAMRSVTLSGLSMDIAVPNPTAMGRTPKVESCVCPEGYSGLSCQQCSPGYQRVEDSSTAMGRCVRCNCNGHASSCDPISGTCRDCQHNTEGDRCERCARGYYGDATVGTPNDCRVCPCPLDIPENSFSPSCFLDTDNQPTCDRCQVGYTGRNCERCAPNYVGNPNVQGGRCERDVGERPSVVVNPVTLNPALGTTAAFQCRPEGRGPFNVVWSRLDGRAISSRSSQGPGPNYVLTINNLEYSDTARYVCSVTNAYGTTRANVQLTVEPPERPLRVRIEEPTDFIGVLGGQARLTCIVVQSRERNPDLRWTKEGGELPERAIQMSGVLIIPNLDYSTLGTYTCIGSDASGRDEAQATISFGDTGPPVLTISPRYIQVNEGEKAELRCTAEGSPQAGVTWTKDNDRKALPSWAYTDETGVLRFDPARPEDQASYYCKATNSAGTTEMRTIIYVQRRTVNINVVVRRTNITAVVGTNEQLSCVAEGGDGTENIFWTRQGGSLPQGSSVSRGVLTLINIQPDFAGDYYCTITTSGNVNVGRARVIVRVTGSAAVAPTARIEPQRTMVGSGQSATLICEVTGEPAPQIQWLRARGDLTDNHQVQGNILRIFRASMADRGIYVCRVSNIAGSSQASAIVDIERREAPRIELYPEPTQVTRLGASVMFQCIIRGGQPAPTLTWSRAGGRPMSPRVTLQDGGVIMFNGVSEEDQGEYVCSATNQMGTVSATASLRIEGPPTIDITPDTNIATIIGERVYVECVATGEPTPTVSWKSGQRRRSDVLPEASEPGPGSAQLLFESVRKTDAGTYICEAVNDRGRSTKTIYIEVNDGDSGVLGITGAAIEGPDQPTYSTGQSVTLTCTASGLTNPRFNWRRGDGQPLPPGHSVRNGVLYIPNIEAEYGGEYICSVVSDPVGPGIPRDQMMARVYIIVTASIQPVTFSVHGAPKPPTTPRPVIFPSGGLTAIAENLFILNCTVSGPGPYQIEWQKSPGPMSPNAIENNGLLTIQRVTLADAGTYKCVVTTPSGSIIEESTRVQVFSPPKVRLDGPPTGEVVMGSTVDLRCTVSGYPTPQVQWDKIEGPLPADHRAQGELLRLFNIQPEDAGTYRCRASNSAGDVRGRYKFTVVDTRVTNRRPPPTRTDIDEGERVELECYLTSPDSSAVTISWQRENGALPTRTRFTGNTMVIEDARPEDSGVYTCRASNQAGSVLSAVELNILPRRTRFQPVQPEYATAALGSPAQLRCDVQGLGNQRVSWVKENGQLPDEHSIDSQGDLIIHRVREEDGGKYECQTRTQFGPTSYPVMLVVGSLVPYFKQNPRSYMKFRPLNNVYNDLDIEMSFKPESTSGLLLYNGQYNQKLGDFVCFGLEDSYPEFRFDNGAGPAVIKGDQQLELNKWHTVKLVRHNLNGTMYVNDETPYSGVAPGSFKGLDLAQPMYVGSVPSFDELPDGAMFTSGYVGGISEIKIKGETLNLGEDALEIIGVDQYDVCRESPCQNEGKCRPWNNRYGFVCECLKGYTGEQCEIRGERCYYGACGTLGTCVNNPSGYGFSCICPLGLRGEMCSQQFSVRDPAFNKTSFISYPTIRDGLLTTDLKLTFKPRSLDDGIVLYNAQQVDGNKDFVAILLKDRFLEFRFSAGFGVAQMQSRQPLRQDEWVHVHARRTGYEGLLIVNNDEAVTAQVQQPDLDPYYTSASWARSSYYGGNTGDTRLRGVDLHGPLYLGGVDPTMEAVNQNVGVIQGFVGCIGDLTVGGTMIDLINDAEASLNIEDCGDRSVCERRPCRNSGNCVDVSPTEYRCMCADGFSGKNCEDVVTICDTDDPCKNGAMCVAFSDGGYRCNCPLGFMGASCEARVQLSTDLEFSGTGYVEFPASTFTHSRTGAEETLIIEFRSTQPNGLLFWQGNPTNPLTNDYIYVALADGYLEFSYELGGGPMLNRSRDRVDDGFVHRARLSRSGLAGTFQVDNKPEVNVVSQGGLQVLNTKGNVYLGGVPSLETYTGNKFSETFSGCVSKLEIKGREITVANDAVGGMNVRPCV